ncbi:MAG: hypothetical protein AAFN92_14725, partial [Bacteroidota bacterium]
MSRIKVQRHSNALEISYNWRMTGLWFLVLWSVIWNFGALFALFAGAGLFISLHVLVGIFVGYFTLTRFFNKTNISVDRQTMRLTHGPLPWPFTKDREIPARALTQLYVNKSSTRVNNKSTYNLVAKLDTGATVKLLKSQQDRKLLTDLERTIETYLDIKNDTSLDLSADGHSQLDLEQMAATLEKMESIKKWLPKSIVAQMEEAKVKMEQQASAMEHPTSPGSARPSGPLPPVSPSQPEAPDWDVSVRLPDGGPRPFPDSEHDFVYPLYRASEGTLFTWNVDPYRIGRTAQIDWADDDQTIGRQLEARQNLTGEVRYLYTELERGRWAYYEERRLDDAEVTRLGFTDAGHPHRFENGEDRYYPRNEQSGTRFVGASGEAATQFVYFTTGGSTQFRALRADGRGWEGYGMEPVDGGG